jgi:hypothetical protein
VDSENHRDTKDSIQGKANSCGKDGDAETSEKPRVRGVEPVQSPLGVIAARGIERTLTKPQPSTRLQRAVNLVTSGDQLSGRQTSCHVQAVRASKIVPKERVKPEQASDEYCNSIEVGKFLGNSEYFHDEGVIYRRRINGE